jgi:hypothetical protein
MNQTTARIIAAQTAGVAVTEDRFYGRWDKVPAVWGVAIGGKFYSEVDTDGNLVLS